MKRTTLRVDGHAYELAQTQNIDATQNAVVDAARAGAGLVTITLVGNREVSVLISPGVPVVFESQRVPDDARDDGDLDAPYEWPDFHPDIDGL